MFKFISKIKTQIKFINSAPLRFQSNKRTKEKPKFPRISDSMGKNEKSFKFWGADWIKIHIKTSGHLFVWKLLIEQTRSSFEIMEILNA